MLQKLLKSLFNALPPSAINDGKVWEVTNALNFVVIYHKCHPIFLHPISPSHQECQSATSTQLQAGLHGSNYTLPRARQLHYIISKFSLVYTAPPELSYKPYKTTSGQTCAQKHTHTFQSFHTMKPSLSNNTDVRLNKVGAIVQSCQRPLRTSKSSSSHPSTLTMAFIPLRNCPHT